MSKVGSKSFPYTAKGKQDAKKESKKSGKKVTMSKSGKTALQEMFDVEQYEAKAGKKDKETKKDKALESMKGKKKSKK